MHLEVVSTLCALTISTPLTFSVLGVCASIFPLETGLALELRLKLVDRIRKGAIAEHFHLTSLPDTTPTSPRLEVRAIRALQQLLVC